MCKCCELLHSLKRLTLQHCNIFRVVLGEALLRVSLEKAQPRFIVYDHFVPPTVLLLYVLLQMFFNKFLSKRVHISFKSWFFLSIDILKFVELLFTQNASSLLYCHIDIDRLSACCQLSNVYLMVSMESQTVIFRIRCTATINNEKRCCTDAPAKTGW